MSIFVQYLNNLKYIIAHLHTVYGCEKYFRSLVGKICGLRKILRIPPLQKRKNLLKGGGILSDTG